MLCTCFHFVILTKNFSRRLNPGFFSRFKVSIFNVWREGYILHSETRIVMHITEILFQKSTHNIRLLLTVEFCNRCYFSSSFQETPVTAAEFLRNAVNLHFSLLPIRLYRRKFSAKSSNRVLLNYVPTKFWGTNSSTLMLLLGLLLRLNVYLHQSREI